MSKFKIKKGRELLSDQEIRQQMNFDKFISGYTSPVKGWISGGTKLYTWIASTSVVLAVAGYLIFNAVKKDTALLKPFVNPPVQAMNIPSDTFELNVNKDSTILYSTGTLITIPAGSFVDDDGKDVTGKVQIHYREFHDPIDIMLSGIPMNYDSAGTQYQLESAGMIDITATKDGQPIHLKPGKTLLVNMISATNNPMDYNTYDLDTIKKKWNYVSENTVKNKTCFPVYENNETPDDAGISSKKTVLPRKAKSNTDNFSIDFNKNEFPELAVYSGLKFEPLEGEKKYLASLSKKTWDDVLIERRPDNEHYIVTFTAKKESHSFTVLPVVDEKDYASAIKDYVFRQKQYEQLLAEKKINAVQKNDSLYKVNEMFKGAALRSNLNERFNNFVNGSYMETSKDLLAYRTFAISNLGIWNSDMPKKFRTIFTFFSKTFQPLEGGYIAKFVSANDQPLLIKNVYIIRRSVNSIFSVAENHFDSFPFYPETMDVIVGITYQNQLVYIKDQELKAAEINGKNIKLKMNKIDPGIISPQQLKKFLKI